MASINYNQCRALPDFVTRYNFDMRFIRLPEGVVIPDNFSLRVLGTDIPKREPSDAEPIIIHGFKISQPDIEFAQGDLNLTMFETEDMATFQMIETWRNLNGNTNTGVAAPRSKITADIRLDLLGRQKLPIWTFDLFDCFLIDHDFGALDSSESSAKMNDIAVTMRYQNFTSSPA